MQKVLLLEDDKDLAELVDIHLKDAGFHVTHAGNAQEACSLIDGAEFSVAILDRNLPDRDGLEVCRHIRSQRRPMSVIMLTCRSDEVDRIVGLEVGADDYVTKPFSVKELVARVRAVLRRHALPVVLEDKEPSPHVTRGELEINKVTRKVLLRGQPVTLTTTEFDLLLYLAEHPGRPFTRASLLSTIWGYEFSGYEHTVNSHINRLRAKIEGDPSNPRFILTVWGIGYRFAEAEEL